MTTVGQAKATNPLVEISVKGPAPRKVERAADALAQHAVDERKEHEEGEDEREVARERNGAEEQRERVLKEEHGERGPRAEVEERPDRRISERELEVALEEQVVHRSRDARDRDECEDGHGELEQFGLGHHASIARSVGRCLLAASCVSGRMGAQWQHENRRFCIRRHDAAIV